jgi:hypothetical protein
MSDFNETLDKVLFKLRDKYPYFTIEVINLKDNKAFLAVNNKHIFKFDPSFMKKEVEFLEEDVKYIDFLVSYFDEPITKFHKKYNRQLLRGMGSKGISLQKVIEACKNTKSNRAASRYLNVHYSTWKKYSKQYTQEDGRTYFDAHKNEKGLGIPRGTGGNGKYSMEDIQSGIVPNDYPAFRYKYRLLRLGIKLEKCENCGFEEQRLTDGKVPLQLDFIDGNALNRKLENVRLLCYNCYFLLSGNMFWRKKGDFTPAYNTAQKAKNEQSQKNIFKKDEVVE